MLDSQVFDYIKIEIKEILKKALDLEEISTKDALKLLKVTGKEFIALQYVADQICWEKKKKYRNFCDKSKYKFYKYLLSRM